MNLHQFRFVQEAVRRDLNLTETAKALFTSQPGVSKQIRALEEEARRSIAGYAGLLGARERAEAIARATREDAASLGAAMTPLQRPDRHRLATAIARLERARRALLPDRRRSLRRPPSFEASTS